MKRTTWNTERKKPWSRKVYKRLENLLAGKTKRANAKVTIRNTKAEHKR